MVLILLAMTALLCVSCAEPEGEVDVIPGDDDDDVPYYSDELFDPDHVVEVEITIDDADAQALAHETTSILALIMGEDCLDHPLGTTYTWFPCDVTVDGVTMEDVGIRKKGLIGSLSTTKPGLKLKFDKYVEGQTLEGVERLTLNNSVSDPSLVRQCLGYQLFADAGLASPRCNFAHVTANGDDLGVYVNVEPAKKRFLRRTYGDEDGDLYEGTLSDLREGWVRTFEPKTSDTDPDHGPIYDAVDAQAVPDDELIDSLEPVLDVDAFLTFWAMEVLVAHLDGYAGNTNNYFVYRDPDTDQITFIPWGIDSIFHDVEVWGFDTGEAVMANGNLANRFFFHDELRPMYEERLLELLDEVWDEGALLDEIDRMLALVEPFAHDDPYMDDYLVMLRDFIENRRAAIEDSIAGGLAWDLPQSESPCVEPVGDMEVTFDTDWDSLGDPDPLNYGYGTLEGTWDDTPIPMVTGGAIAGEYSGQAAIAMVGMATQTVAAEGVVVFDMPSVTPGSYALEMGLRVGHYMTLDTQTQQDFVLQAYIGDGELVLEEAATTPGAPIRGSFSGQLLVPVAGL